MMYVPSAVISARPVTVIGTPLVRPCSKLVSTVISSEPATAATLEIKGIVVSEVDA